MSASSESFTTLMVGIMIPLAGKLGLDYTTITMMVPNLSIGIMWPWAGPATATAFASGRIQMKDMVKVGVPATLIFSLIVGVVHAVFAFMG